MRVKLFFFVLVFPSLSVKVSVAQNQFNSRLFYIKPALYHSKSKVTSLNLSKFDVSVSLPIDKRSKFYGEEVYRNIKTHAMDEFFKSSTMTEIQNKIESDMKGFGAGRIRKPPPDKIAIGTVVEIFYPRISGFIHGKSLAKIRLAMTATLNDSLLISNTYESFYITDGTDKEFEGDLLMTVEDGTNTTVGMTLRKTLDQFYDDLKMATGKEKKIRISGKVISSKTGKGVSAKISFGPDSSFSVSSSPDGKFALDIAFSRHYRVSVTASDYVTYSEQFDPGSSLRVLKKDFTLHPIAIGTVISLKNVLFYMGTTDLLEESYHELDGVVAFLKTNSKIKIELRGYTDNRGDAKKDLALSQDRVGKIKSYLVSKGISTHRIVGKGFGSSKPIASNNTEDGRKLNRRVEFVIVKN